MLADTPLTTGTPASLGPQVEANLFALFRAMQATLGGDLEETPALSRFYTFPSSPLFKGVFNTRLTPAAADAAIADTVAWYQARQAPYFFWWAGADSRPADLEARLLAHGLTAFEQNAPALVAALDDLRWDNPRPADLRLTVVASDADLLHWKAVFLESFGLPEFAGQAWVDATRAAGFTAAPWQLLLGTVSGTPAVCGLLYCGAGVAGLIGLGTLPAYRRRGLGSAMQLERLRLARERGYRYAALFASEMGLSPYLKLGFQDTGRRLSRYLWRAA